MLSEQNIFVQMDRSHVEFHLTGSRYFGTARPESDWDYFVQGGPGVAEELERMGFVKEAKLDYTDILRIEVHRHPDNIHVQVVSNVEHKILAQEIIFDNRLLGTRSSKEHCQLVWRCVLLGLWSLRTLK